VIEYIAASKRTITEADVASLDDLGDYLTLKTLHLYDPGTPS